MSPPLLLTEAAARHVLINPVSALYANQVRARCAAFAAWSGRALTVDDIANEPSLLSAFLLTLEASGLKRVTVRGYRACILAVCHSVLPATTLGPLVRRVKRQPAPPTCWTDEELRDLIHAASRCTGARVDGVRWTVWWLAFIHTAYSSGQRLADLLAASRDDIRADGVWTVTQQKTGAAVTVQLSVQAMKYGQAIGHPTNWLPWPYSEETLRKRFRELVDDAAIRPGSIKWIRRTAGSYFERDNPGAGHRLLGNTRQVFDDAYHDRTITQPVALQAPSLLQ